ncbi:MAG: fused MFS/spermidine synthase, partial [Acidobacteriota bacterium]
FQSKDPTTARPIRVITVDPYFVQSAIFLDSDDIVFRYNHYYHLLRHFRPGFQKTLMIGGAGYTFPREYLRTYPNSSIDVVEIDPGMTQIARGHFRLKDDPRMRVIHTDGRVFLNQTEAGIYDAVLMDAFGSLFSVPYQLTTVEAVRQIDRALKPGGIVILNLGSAISGSGSLFLRAELKTFIEVFADVRVFKVRPEYRDDELQNIILIACKTECSSNASGDPEIAALLQTAYRSEIPLDVPVLTDDLAPVEYYNSFALDLYQKSR